jgi:hypothetical protein
MGGGVYVDPTAGGIDAAVHVTCAMQLLNTLVNCCA